MLELSELELYQGIWCRKGTRDKDAVRQVAATWASLEPQQADVVLDLGSHVGSFAVLAARTGAAVRAYEPHPGNFEVLCRNLEPFPDAEAIPNAVTRDGGVVSFYLSRTTNTMAHSVVPKRGRKRMLVDSIPLPEALAVNPTLVKIDIEGAEHEIGLDLVEWPASLRGVAIEIELPSLARQKKEWWLDSAQRIVENLQRQGFAADELLEWPDYTKVKAGPGGSMFTWAEANLVFRR